MKKMSQNFFLAILILAIGAPLTSAQASRPITQTVTVDGMERQYIVYLPEHFNRLASWPVLLAFHPGAEPADRFAGEADFQDAALAREFVIVYPQGYKNTWNAIGCCGAAAAANIDDIKFVKTIINNLANSFPVDPRRIYASGYSNGGDMAYKVACILSDGVAAIAPVSSAMRTNCDPSPSHPISVFEWHGLKDRFTPYYGGATPDKNSTLSRPVQDTIDYWRGVDGTRGPVVNETLGGGVAACTIYTGGRSGTDVKHCVISDMGHRWPGSHPTAYSIIGDRILERILGVPVGPYSPPIDADDAILDFFKNHPRQ